MKIAYIAHPIGGDVENNLKRIYAIIRKINLEEAGVVPFAPYLGDCLAMDDSISQERERGIRNNMAIMSQASDVIYELRLYGDTISNGMASEIRFAIWAGIPVRPMTDGTNAEYQRRFSYYTKIQ